jgi:peptidyl-prolyl cis-trans isomerase D
MFSYVKFDLGSVKLAEPTPADIDKLIAAEPKAIEERYQADAARYRTPEERQGRMIFLKLAKDATDADVARARSELQTLRDQVGSGADFGAIAKEKSQDPATKDKGGDLGFHKRGELAPAIDEALFTLKKDEISKDPVRADDGLALVQVTALKEPQPKPLDSVKREVAASILRERAADEQLKGQADKVLAELKGGKKLDEITVSEDEKNKPAEAKADKKGAKPVVAAADKPLRYDSAWIIKTQDAIPRIGVAPELQKEIFTLTKDSPVAPKAYKVNRAYYVVVLKDRETPDLAKFQTEKESLREQAVWTKRTQVFQDWLKHLRTVADVQLNPALLSRAGRDQG